RRRTRGVPLGSMALDDTGAGGCSGDRGRQTFGRPEYVDRGAAALQLEIIRLGPADGDQIVEQERPVADEVVVAVVEDDRFDARWQVQPPIATLADAVPGRHSASDR